MALIVAGDAVGFVEELAEHGDRFVVVLDGADVGGEGFDDDFVDLFALFN